MSKVSRENPIVTRSRSALVKAATELLQDHEPSTISVTQVVESAGMSRPTFYQHFSDLGALFAEAGMRMLDKLLAGATAELTSEEAPLEALAATLIETMEAHAHFLHRVETSTGGAEFHARVVERATAILRTDPRLRDRIGQDEATWEFLAAGTVWLVTRHLAAHCAAGDATRLPGADLDRIIRGLTDDRSDWHIATKETP